MRKTTKYSSFIIATLLATTPILVSQKVQATTDTSSESGAASNSSKVNQENNGTKSGAKGTEDNGSSTTGSADDDDDDSDGTTQSGSNQKGTDSGKTKAKSGETPGNQSDTKGNPAPSQSNGNAPIMTGNPKDYEDGQDYGYKPVPGFPIISITKTDPNFYVKNGMTPNEISDFFNDKKNYSLINKEFSDTHITYGSLTTNYDPDDDYDTMIHPDVWCVYKKDSKGNVDYKQVVGDDEKLVEGNGYEIVLEFSVMDGLDPDIMYNVKDYGTIALHHPAQWTLRYPNYDGSIEDESHHYGMSNVCLQINVKFGEYPGWKDSDQNKKQDDSDNNSGSTSQDNKGTSSDNNSGSTSQDNKGTSSDNSSESQNNNNNGQEEQPTNINNSSNDFSSSLDSNPNNDAVLPVADTPVDQPANVTDKVQNNESINKLSDKDLRHLGLVKRSFLYDDKGKRVKGTPLLAKNNNKMYLVPKNVRMMNGKLFYRVTVGTNTYFVRLQNVLRNKQVAKIDFKGRIKHKLLGTVKFYDQNGHKLNQKVNSKKYFKLTQVKLINHKFLYKIKGKNLWVRAKDVHIKENNVF